MNDNQKYRLLFLVASLWIFAAAATAADSADDLFWTHSEPCNDAFTEILSCGSYGPLHLSADLPPLPTDDCAMTVKGDQHWRYPVAGTADPDPGWTPCEDGSCFTDSALEPWVAVIDWDAPHGRSVGATIVESSGEKVLPRLYALEDSGSSVIDGLDGVGDAHVLAQLCRLTEDVETLSEPELAPLLLNMSFGRLAPPGPSCIGLACEIEGVLAHLRGLGVFPLAAAGNHGKMLFPAAAASTLSIGSLDLGHFGRTGEAQPIAQTPKDAFALFPGYGLHLRDLETRATWAVPPGSSYASAYAAGWIAGYLRDYPGQRGALLTDCQDGIEPVMDLDSGNLLLYLTCGSQSFTDSALKAWPILLERALGYHPQICNGSLVASSQRTVRVATSYDDLPSKTMDDVRALLNRPTPDSRPCVPCHGVQGDGTASLSDATSMTINMSESDGFPPDVELLGLYLDVDGDVYRFSDSRNTMLLADLQDGLVDTLYVEVVPPAIEDKSVSLVYELRFVDEAETFTTSIPVNWHSH
jgi:hypothetical protein